MEDTRLPKCVIFGELVGVTVSSGGQEMECMGCLLDDLRAFGIKTDQWMTTAQDEGEWHRLRHKKLRPFFLGQQKKGRSFL